MGRNRTHPMLSKINRESLLKELENNGYAIIPNAAERCDEKFLKYQEWFAGFKETGNSIQRDDYVIDKYRISHSEASWGIRGQVRQLFGLVWETDKLLTSVEGVILFNPPEKGEGDFRTPDACNLHLEQGVRRQGLHAYRGAVYLEESTDEDFCFRVLTESHKHHSEFFEDFPRAASKSKKNESLKLTKNERTWYFDKGCKLVSVTVPKGGLLLWDARMVFDFVLPECGRKNIDRWAAITLVTMTPALWADKDDIELKQKVFKDLSTTTHWASQGQKVISERRPVKRNALGDIVENIAVKFPTATALWYPCQKLMGMMEYDFENPEENRPLPPAWK